MTNKFSIGDRVWVTDGPNKELSGRVLLIDQDSSLYRYCVNINDKIFWFREAHLSFKKPTVISKIKDELRRKFDTLLEEVGNE